MSVETLEKILSAAGGVGVGIFALNWAFGHIDKLVEKIGDKLERIAIALEGLRSEDK